ncbi:hypothetical protein BWQ96_05092 [Gracilariopsis chorda]|uniref:Uncharacterized protein n=1 Tax=Gracilariopsis chorda TaxID=448386 RepID=A0A2V3ISU4_9FLOR|nr:hypothetical protein BWQ96_05092 [Gracilariopsis chorda]|eukprot:PXF45191.1 hypothetical protein BWQ96_05092 [Gracilariopsis chorda]
MDQLFAQVVDHIALSGSAGASLLDSLTAVLGRQPRRGLVIYLHRQFAARSDRFFAKPSFNAPAHEVRLTAHDNIRQRALGFTPLEQSPLPSHAYNVLERIGMAGSNGILQSELGKYVGLAPNMVHHYLGVLMARSLVARKKVVLTKQRTVIKKEQLTDQPVTNQETLTSGDGLGPSVTYTAVVVLARYALNISQSTASKSLAPPHDQPQTEPSPESTSQQPSKASSAPSVIDLTMETRIERIMLALQPSPHTRSEKDLKVIAMPDSDKQEHISDELFRRRRHRGYRALRSKLVRAGLVEIVQRECIARDGKHLGNHACLKLTSLGLEKLQGGLNSKLRSEDLSAHQRSAHRKVHPLLQDGTRARFLEEVGLVEQVYQLIKRSGKEGISIPEIHEYLDGGTDLTGAVGKRIRRIVDSISRIEPTIETQRFEGSAMYIRIALRSIACPEGESNDLQQPNSQSLSQHERTPGSQGKKRRKVGITTLGQQRQEIVMKLLESRKVVILETLGREVATVEDAGLHRVDQKVMRRLLNDLIKQNAIKLITAVKPAIKDCKRSQTVTLVALPEVAENGQEVRSIMTSVVNRALYGSTEGASIEADKRNSESMKEEPSNGKSYVDLKNVNRNGDAAIPIPDRSRLSQERNAVHPKKPAPDDDQDNGPPIVVYEHNIPKGKTAGDSNAQVNCRKRSSSNDKKRTKLKESSKTAEEDKLKPPSSKVRDVTGEMAIDTQTTTIDDNAKPTPLSASNKSARHSKGGSKDKGGAAVCVESDGRDKRKLRINKLRSIDYGLLKGKLARVRVFHRTIFGMLQPDRASRESEKPIPHHSVEDVFQAENLGCFKVGECLSSMTVSEYAAVIGFYQDHGDLITSRKEERIANIRDQLDQEINSQTAARQILSLVQMLTRLGLVESNADSQWTLAGQGIIRDFGKGLPSGVVPHGIVFSDMKAVDTFWRELEQFARCRMSRKPPNSDMTPNPEEGTSADSEGERKMLPVTDVYYPNRWSTGVVRLQKRDQLLYEAILQRANGVEIELNLPNALLTTAFNNEPLRRFSIEELEEAFATYIEKIPSLKATQRSTPSHEKLLMYSRYRTKNPMPTWIREREQKLQRQDYTPEKVEDEFAGDYSCILHLSSRASEVEGRLVRVGIPLLGKRPSTETTPKNENESKKTPKLRKKSSIQSFAGTAKSDQFFVEGQRMVMVCKALVKSRAMAYYCRNSEALEWKGAVNMINWFVRKFYKDQVKKDSSLLEVLSALAKAMVSFCDMFIVRRVLDIISLKVVIHGRRCGAMNVVELDDEVSKSEVLKWMDGIVDNWSALERVVLALITLVEKDLKYSGKIRVTGVMNEEVGRVSNAKKIIEEELEMNGLFFGREANLGHTLEAMAWRFQRIADLRLRENVSHGILFECMSVAGEAIRKRPWCCTRIVQQQERNIEGEHMAKRDKLRSLQGAAQIERILPNVSDLDDGERMCGKGRHRDEIMDLVVLTLGRQERHRQDCAESRELLNRFCWSDIALARDRLLLRGALVYRDDKRGGGMFATTKIGNAHDITRVILEDDGKFTERWTQELMNAGGMAVEWEASKLKSSVCDKGEVSVSSIAMEALTRKLLFSPDGLQMRVSMTNSGTSTEAVQLSLRHSSGEERNSGLEEDANDGERIMVDAALQSTMQERLAREIRNGGCLGKRLDELLRAVEPRTDEERAAMVQSLHGLVDDGTVRRFAVEERQLRDEQFAAWDGVLYVSAMHVAALSLGNRAATLCWWRDAAGLVDQRALSGVRTAVLMELTRGPGRDGRQVAGAVVSRLGGSVPRRAVLDVMCALVASGELVVRACAAPRSGETGFRLLPAVARSQLRFVDGAGVFAWGRRWRSVWYVRPARAVTAHRMLCSHFPSRLGCV